MARQAGQQRPEIGDATSATVTSTGLRHLYSTIQDDVSRMTTKNKVDAYRHGDMRLIQQGESLATIEESNSSTKVDGACVELVEIHGDLHEQLCWPSPAQACALVVVVPSFSSGAKMGRR